MLRMCLLYSGKLEQVMLKLGLVEAWYHNKVTEV